MPCILIIIAIIIAIICVYAIIFIIVYYSMYSYFTHYTYYTHQCYFAGWLQSVGSRIVYELDYRNPVLHAIPVQSILGKLAQSCCSPRRRHRDNSVSPAQRLSGLTRAPATAGRVLAMAAGCGSLTRGLWGGPVICNARDRFLARAAA